MSEIDNFMNALMSKPPQPPEMPFQDRWQPVIDQLRFAPQNQYKLGIESEKRGWRPQSVDIDPVPQYDFKDGKLVYKKMDDSPTNIQNMRTTIDLLQNHPLRKSNTPSLEIPPDILMQLLNPDQTMKRVTPQYGFRGMPHHEMYPPGQAHGLEEDTRT